MSLSVCVSIYIVGFLMFPFFYSLIDNWPFVSSRLKGDDVLFSFLACTTWPLAALVWLMSVWWCGISWLGASARKLCGRLMKTLDNREVK